MISYTLSKDFTLLAQFYTQNDPFVRAYFCHNSGSLELYPLEY